MDIEVCAQCGNEVDGKGVKFRDRLFCSDACCDEFEEELSAQDELEMEDLDDIGDLDDMDDLDDLDDLEEDELVSRSKKDLGYRDDDDGFDDDDYVIDDDDF